MKDVSSARQKVGGDIFPFFLTKGNEKMRSLFFSNFVSSLSSIFSVAMAGMAAKDSDLMQFSLDRMKIVSLQDILPG
jgi:hypothetical protein